MWTNETLFTWKECYNKNKAQNLLAFPRSIQIHWSQVYKSTFVIILLLYIVFNKLNNNSPTYKIFLSKMFFRNFWKKFHYKSGGYFSKQVNWPQQFCSMIFMDIGYKFFFLGILEVYHYPSTSTAEMIIKIYIMIIKIIKIYTFKEIYTCRTLYQHKR